MNAGAIFLLLICTLLMLTMGFNFVDGIAEGASLKNLLLYGMLLWYGKEIRQGKARPLRQVGAVHKAFIVMALWAAFATLLAFATGVSSYEIIGAVFVWKNEFFDVLAILLVTCVVIRNQNVAFAVLRLLLFGIAGLAALTVVEVTFTGVHFFGMDVDSLLVDAVGRPKGPFGEPNQTAAVLAMLLPIALALAVPRDSFRAAYLAVAMTLVAAILVTGSRGGLAGAAAGGLALMYLLRRSFGIGGKLVVLLALPLLAVLAWSIIPALTQEMMQERIESLFDARVNAEVASAGRTMIWGSALEIWQRQPFTGIGWTGFRNVFHGATHNEFMRYLTETGVVGLAIYLMLWWRVVSCFLIKPGASTRAPFVRAGALAAICALLVSTFFVNLYKPWLIVWCILGVLMCYLSYEHIEHLRRVERARAEREKQQTPDAVVSTPG
jgi:O-antigen ligase